MAEKSLYFYQDFSAIAEKAKAKHLTCAVLQPLQMVTASLTELDSSRWHATVLHGIIETVATSCGLQLGKLAQPMRVAVTGDTVSPPIDLTMQLLGQDKVIARLKQALALIDKD